MKKILLTTCCWFMCIMLGTLSVIAQFQATGTITDDNEEPLIGVSVSVKNTTIGTITDLDGKYTLKVPSNDVILVYSYIGYKTEEMEASSASSNVDMILKEDVSNLDEIVVTGLATSVKRSNSANSVAAISAKELSEITSQSTMDGALYGKFKGANITSNSGAPGGGISVKLRGLTSINGNNQPLYIIDGVYMDNSAIPAELNTVSAAGAGGSQVSQDNPTNRIADLDPEDIANIEILKGASAAAIYGSRAAGGVVIITTKRGEAGKTEVKLSQSLGLAQILNPLGTREWDENKIKAQFGTEDDPDAVTHVDAFEAAQASGNIMDYEQELYGNRALLSTSRISVSGGTNSTKFFAGFTNKNDEGIVDNTGYQKTSFRINVDQKLSKRIDISLSSNFINSLADRGFFNNDNSGTTMGVSFISTPSWAQLLPDENGIYPDNPYGTSNFLQTGALITNNEKVNRILAGGTVTAKLFNSNNQSLKLITRGGIDNYTLNTNAIFPNSLQFMNPANGGLNGVSIQGNTINVNANLAAFLVHSFFLDSGLSFRTQLGLTAENFNRNTIVGTTSNLNGTQSNLDQGGNRNTTQNKVIQYDRGFFVQEEINVSDKILATFGVRADKSSNNGDANQLYFYPKASLAVNVHEFQPLGTVSQLKIRGAYGESGNFALFGDKYTTFDGNLIDGQLASEIFPTLGNPDVAPERQTELEFGADIGLLEDKIVLDATYYIKTVKDLLLRINIPSSSGYAIKVVNGAELENKGFEIGLNLNIVNNKDLGWNHRIGFWQNNSLVTRLDFPAYNTGAFGATLGTFRIEEGQSPTQIIGITSDPDDEDGIAVFGDAQPDFNMSFLNSMRFKGFDFSFLVHWKKGGSNVNLTTLLTDLNGTSPDYDATGLDPEGSLGNGAYRLSQLGSSASVFVEDASYVRLREIGLYYNIPKSVFKDVVGFRVGVSAYNALNFFTYNSYDPEVSNFGGQGLSSGVEVTPFPSSKRFNFHISASF